jgi:hypothetical protein
MRRALLTFVLSCAHRNRRSKGEEGKEEEFKRHHSGEGFQIAKEKEKERERMALMMGYSSSDTKVATTASVPVAKHKSESESDKERSDGESELSIRIRAASVYGSGEHVAVAAAAAAVLQKEKRKKRTASTRIQRVKEGPSKWLQRTASLTNIPTQEGPVAGQQGPKEGETEKEKEKAKEGTTETSASPASEKREKKHKKKEKKQEKRKKREKSRQMDVIPHSQSEEMTGSAGRAAVKAVAPFEMPRETPEAVAVATSPVHEDGENTSAAQAKDADSPTALQLPSVVPAPEQQQQQQQQQSVVSAEPDSPEESAAPVVLAASTASTRSSSVERDEDERLKELAALAKAVTKAVASSVKDAVTENARPRPVQQHQRNPSGLSHDTRPSLLTRQTMLTHYM